MDNFIVLSDLYGRIYDFTDVAGDSPLELMDEIIEREGCTELFDKFLDEVDLSNEDANRLAEVLREVIQECEFEFGEFEDED